MLAVVALDLVTWGQSSGWRMSSQSSDSELWGEPESVRYLRGREGATNGEPFRILTQDLPFDPERPVAATPAGARWIPTLQPDVYMMHGIENAAGYDGFGLARYSRLAGDMKVWGELADPERSLRGESRELDLLSVRYLLTRSPAAATVNAPASSAAPSTSSADAPPSFSSAPPSSSSSASPPAPLSFPDAAQTFEGLRFASEDLGVPSVGAGAQLWFDVPPVEANRFALLTNLSWSVDVPDGATVARVRLRAEGGKTFDFDLHAGEHTSEWAYDRADIRAQVKHRRAPVATSYKVEDAQARYEGHTYVASFTLPERAGVTGGEISVARVASAPELILSVMRASLLDEAAGKAFPLRREWMKKESAPASNDKPLAVLRGEQSVQPQDQPAKESEGVSEPRWRRLERLGDVAVFENARVLPRAWLAHDAVVLDEERMLEAIRTGRLPGGETWEPRRTALVEAPVEFKQTASEDAEARAEVTEHEANRVEVKTAAVAPSILVLSENHFPGWRAYVDGRATETLRVDYNLRGVALAAGEHTVEFVYRPKSVLYGLLVSLLTLAALLVWAAGLVPESLSRRRT
jgi:hypothetical protein